MLKDSHYSMMPRQEQISTVLWLREHSLWHVIRNWWISRRMTRQQESDITQVLNRLRKK